MEEVRRFRQFQVWTKESPNRRRIGYARFWISIPLRLHPIAYSIQGDRSPPCSLHEPRPQILQSCLYLLPTHSATSDLLISSNSSGDDSPHHIIDNQQRSKTQRFMRHSPCMMSAGMWESYRCSENLSALVTSTDEYAESKRW